MVMDMKLLQKCAKGLLDLVLEGEGHALIYREFSAREPKLREVAFESFCQEFVPAKLALGCVSWVGCCMNHGIEDKELRNIFFKDVMSLFASPKSLENATRFSESLYASNADPEQSPVLGVLVHLFHRLGLEAIVKFEGESVGGLNAGFSFMMEVADALKNAFETQFDDFYFANVDATSLGDKSH